MRKSFYIFIAMGTCLLISTTASVQLFAQNPDSAPYGFFRAKQYRKAIEVSQEVIKADKSNISAYVVSGWSHLSLGEWQQALDIAKQGEAVNATDPRLIQIIGEAYFRLGDDEQALQYFSKYLITLPNGQLRDWVYYYMGIIYERKNKLAKAEIAFSTAVSLDDERASWWEALARVQDKQNHKKEAIIAYQKVLSINPENTQIKQKIVQLEQ